jgi:hypothetical protein
MSANWPSRRSARLRTFLGVADGEDAELSSEVETPDAGALPLHVDVVSADARLVARDLIGTYAGGGPSEELADAGEQLGRALAPALSLHPFLGYGSAPRRQQYRHRWQSG